MRPKIYPIGSYEARDHNLSNDRCKRWLSSTYLINSSPSSRWFFFLTLALYASVLFVIALLGSPWISTTSLVSFYSIDITFPIDFDKSTKKLTQHWREAFSLIMYQAQRSWIWSLRNDLVILSLALVGWICPCTSAWMWCNLFPVILILWNRDWPYTLYFFLLPAAEARMLFSHLAYLYGHSINGYCRICNTEKDHGKFLQFQGWFWLPFFEESI